MLTRIFEIFGAIVAWSGLAVQYAIMLRNPEFASSIAATLRFLGYFTILSNLLAAAILTVSAISPSAAIGRWFAGPSVRSAVALYLFVTAAVYHIILASQWNPEGWQLLADTILHTVTPALYLGLWLVSETRGSLSFRSIGAWLIFPIAFGVIAMMRGIATGFYPYFFLNVDELGLVTTIFNIAVLGAMFAAIGAGLVGADQKLGRIRRANGRKKT